MHYIFVLYDTATTAISTLPLHDALPIFRRVAAPARPGQRRHARIVPAVDVSLADQLKQFSFGKHYIREVEARELDLLRKRRSEEHTSELQSQSNLVCRLLLEKKKNKE